MGEHSTEARVTGVRFPPAPFHYIFMARRKKMRQLEFGFMQEPQSLTLKTIQSTDENTLEVSATLPIDTIWRIYPFRNGLHLKLHRGGAKNHPIYKISNYISQYNWKEKYLEIRVECNSFKILSNDFADLCQSVS